MVRSVSQSIRKRDRAVSLDVKATYQNVPILLCFSFQGRCCQIRMLPLPPYVFTKLAKCLTARHNPVRQLHGLWLELQQLTQSQPS